MPTAARKRGGAAAMKETNGKREPGTFKKFDGAATVSKLGTKTTSDGFAKGGPAKRKDGGAIDGASSAPTLAKRARGGRTSAPFSNVHAPKMRQGSSSSGHEGE